MTGSTNTLERTPLVEELSVGQRRLREKMARELRLLEPFLEDDLVQEIIVNPDGLVFVDRAGQAREEVGVMPESIRENFLATVATSLNTKIDHRQPTIDGRLLLDGSRVSGEIPPVVTAASFRIRKHAKLVKPLEYFVETDVMSPEQFALIDEAIRAKRNIIVVGSTASGKTFLANSLLHRIAVLCPTDRILTIEDTPELKVSSTDYTSWVVAEPVSMQSMLHRALRATPDRIVVGEVRGAEAYQLAKMWNTGHGGGVATIHSDKGPLDGLHRLEQCCVESPEFQGMGEKWIRSLVGDVAHVLVNLVKTAGRRRIESIVFVNGYDAAREQYDIDVVPTERAES